MLLHVTLGTVSDLAVTNINISINVYDQPRASREWRTSKVWALGGTYTSCPCGCYHWGFRFLLTDGEPCL